MVLDITARKQAEQALQESHDKLEQRVKTRTAELTKEIESRIQVEQALRESEERYRALAESAQDLIYSIDRQWEIQYANRAAITFWGGNVIGKRLQELFPPEEFTGMKTILQSVFAAGTSASVVSKLALPDREIWLDTQLVALSSRPGKIDSVMGISHDITERKQAQEALAQRNMAMEALYMTSLEINTQPDLTALLQSIVQRAASLLRTQQGSLSLLQPHGRTLKQVAPHNFELPFTYPDQALGEGLAGRVAHSGEMLMISDYASWEGRLPIPEMNGRIVGVPLKRGEQVIGVLEVWDADETGTFDTEEVQLLSMFANQAAGAIENARLFEAEQKQHALAEALRETAEMLSQSLELDVVLDRILASVQHIIAHDASDIALVEDDEISAIARHRGFEERGLADWMSPWRFSVADTPVTEKIIQSETPVIISDTHNSDLWVEIAEMDWVRSFMAMPIRVQGEFVGSINLLSSELDRFLPEHSLPLQAFANQAAVAIENARLFEQVSAARERLQGLSRRLVQVQEDERRYIARELHDEFGQLLTGLKYRLEASRQLPVEKAVSSLEKAEVLVGQMIVQVRKLSLELRPVMLDDLGLLPALLWLIEQCQAQFGFSVNFEHNELEERFSPEVETGAYRIVQEALTNVARHAGASNVFVHVGRDSNAILVKVQDDGKGFDPESVQVDMTTGGVTGMHERAVLLGGHLSMDTANGSGTRLTAKLPLGGFPETRSQEKNA